MFNTEKFVLEVQARPVLWQTELKSFHSRLQRIRGWEDLAQGMYGNWDEYSEMKRNEIVKELQKKWRNLRDYHIKLRKKDKVLKRKAPYLELLTFLDMPGENYTVPEKKSRSDTDDDVEDFDEQMSNLSHAAEAGYNIKKENFETETYSPLLSNVTSLSEDPDRSFLISILPHIKTLDERQKFKFKLKTMKLLDRLKYNSCETPEPQEEYDPLSKSTTSI